MVAGERVARACGPGVLLQEPTDYIKEGTWLRSKPPKTSKTS